MSASRELNPRAAWAVIVLVAAGILYGAWHTFLRQPPQKMPPGVTDPSRLTEDYYAGRYRPGVGYVNTPQQPGASRR